MSKAQAPSDPPVELVELHAHQEYRVCKDDQDPRGWTVLTSDAFKLGAVTDLIIDEVGLSARYIVCAVSASGRRILIPTGFARLDEKEQIVHLDFITTNEVERLPTYHGLPLTVEEQQHVESALTGRMPAHPDPLITRRSSRPAE